MLTVCQPPAHEFQTGPLSISAGLVATRKHQYRELALLPTARVGVTDAWLVVLPGAGLTGCPGSGYSTQVTRIIDAKCLYVYVPASSWPRIMK